MKQPWVRSKVIIGSLVVGIILNVALCNWLKVNSLGAFRLAGMVHAVEYRINDLFHFPSLLVEKDFNAMLDEFPLEFLIDNVRDTWLYTEDHKYWDVAELPVESFLSNSGDCDDFARLVAHILHQKGIDEVYYIMLVSNYSGHAATVYHDSDSSTINLVDVSGIWLTLPLVEDFDISYHVPQLIKYVFVDTVHLDIRTWDTRHSIEAMTVKEILTDANLSW